MTRDEAEKIRDEQRKKLDEAQRALDLAERQERLDRQRDLRPIAELAHKLCCPYNHTDGCGWLYELDRSIKDEDVKWEHNEHSRWLHKVERVMKDSGIGADVLMKMLTEYEALVAGNKKFTWILLLLRGL